jgi:GntR family transcriptional repressor for pyruvate dehydrogenase complex
LHDRLTDGNKNEKNAVDEQRSVARVTSAKRPRPAPITRRRKKSGGQKRGGDEVVGRILELVQDGYLHPGDRLPPERELIDIFGIGRPNLRESLRALQTLGIIEIRHGGGAFITALDAKRLLAPLNFLLSLTPEVLEDSTEMRRIVETVAIQKAAPRITAADLEEFDVMLQAHGAVRNDYVGFLILDSRFHSRIYQLSGNVVLEQIATALYNIGLDHRRELMSRPGEIAKSTKDHHAIVAALKTKNPSLASKAMEIHLKHIADSSRKILRARSRNSAARRP